MAFQYEKAPITEALIDIRAALPDDVTLSTLEALHGQVTEWYPEKKKRIEVEGQIGLEAPPTAKRTEMGFFVLERGRQADLPG